MTNKIQKATRVEYDPRLMRFLVESLAKKFHSQTNAASLNSLAITLSTKSESENQPPIGDSYISKLYKESQTAIDKGEPIVKEDKMINALVHFTEYENLISLQETFDKTLSKHIIDNPTGQKKRSNEQPLDEYEIRARLLPLSIGLLPITTLLASVPFIKSLNENLTIIEISLILILGIGGIFYVIVSFSDLVAGLSKVYQNKYFIKENGFPSTYLLLYSNQTFGENYKNNYRRKIQNLANIKLLTKEEELNDKNKAIQELNSAAEYVKQHVYEGLVKTQNIRYGFTRNLIGATFLGIPFSIMTVIIGIATNSHFLIIASSTLLILYTVILSFKKHLLTEVAEGYAKELISKFLQK